MDRSSEVIARERPIVVALNGQINPLSAGGTEASVMSIVKHVSPRNDDIRMLFISLPQFAEAFRKIAPQNCDVIEWPYPLSAPVRSDVQGERWVSIRTRLGHAAPLFDYAVWMRRRLAARGPLPMARQCDVLLSKHGVDVVHFGWPTTFPTRRPFIYEPHDLQHRHYPEFFPAHVRRWREKIYGNACRNAAFVVCGTWWTKQDIMRQYGVPSERVAVIQRASVKARIAIPAEREAEIAKELDLPVEFIFYSAMTFEHKNHVRLIHALKHLRDSAGLRINLLMTGRPIEPVFGKIKAAIEAGGLHDQVRFLGTVPEDHLTVIYKRARLMVFPSLFEGLSQSLLEAMAAGLPVIAAGQSSIPETCGSAGLYFDGENDRSIAITLAEALARRERLCEMAAATAHEMQRYEWEPAARTFIAVYRKAAERTLTAEQRELLSKATRAMP